LLAAVPADLDPVVTARALLLLVHMLAGRSMCELLRPAQDQGRLSQNQAGLWEGWIFRIPAEARKSRV
jgi:hypothetical protein